MHASSEPGRPLSGRQREARSNDLAVLAAAREVFSAQGHGASMADIARHAGVGIGSIYRRYPTKQDLVGALHLQGVREAGLLVHAVADECAAAAQAARGGEPSGAVATFLSRQITGATGPILRPPDVGRLIDEELAAASEDLRSGLERLIAHDRALRLIPEGFTAADVMQLLLHLRPPLPGPRAHADALHLRYLQWVVRGLRELARADTALTDSPEWDEWMGYWRD
ncbi:helix-turn-helix domain-containing protein [Rhodococcus sp. NPDC058505]|uniref:helix-turn-helix domain-containing protein n=1 Tax=unclassified Rhodococcus (in: high G+C Gram-positive bacteria) TaxID=192944 RepID=UPI00364A46E9